MKQLDKLPKAASSVAFALTSGFLFWWALKSGNPLWMITAAVGAVGSLTMGIKWLSERRTKAALAAAKVEPAAEGEPAVAAEPETDPRERIDELKKSFRQGVKRFLPFRKDLYSVPWYLVVGETGAGKTEAIRHSSLGFPPGLQDENQGVGGTENLHWWFTNQAVILDTAGEWIFREDQEDAPSEWIELFKLLKSHRPRTPLNGIVLTISADSLLADSPEEMKTKAGKIARKLSQVQRLLDIRFPVFVMVTKSDTIVGFREFFEKSGTAEQNQMLGWSNPASVDEPYQPAALDSHLEGVFADLKRRRLELLAAPPARKATAEPGADPMAALYAFPENLKLILPGLRTYLESIFLLGEWSAKPLFLRGVFFTSSMRQGPPLDVQAQEMFSAPAQTAGHTSESHENEEDRERSYFLHDLFAEKVFREKGLIFSANSAKSHKRISRALLWSFSLASIALLIFLTWLSSYTLQDEVGVEQAYWESAAEPRHWKRRSGCLTWNPVLDTATGGGLGYAESDSIRVDDKSYTSGTFLGRIADRAGSPMRLPWTFRFTAEIEGGLSKRRLTAARALFESSVLCPLYNAAVRKMTRQSADHWTPEASAAVGELLRLEVQKVRGEAGDQLVDLDALFRFVLPEADYRRYARNDAKVLGAALRKLYAGRNSEGWPPERLKVGSRHSRYAVTEGIKDFKAYWADQMKPKPTSRFFSHISALTEAGEDFLQAEMRLSTLSRAAALEAAPPASLVAHNVATGEWERQFETMRAARKRIRKNVGGLEGGSLKKTYEQNATDALDGVKKGFEELRALMKPVTETDDKNQPVGTDYLADLDAELELQLKTIMGGLKKGAVLEKISDLDASAFAAVGDGITQRAFEARYKLYALGHHELTKRPGTPGVFGLKEALAAEHRDLKLTREVIRKRAKQLMTVRAMKEAAEASLYACNLAERWRAFVQIKAALDQVRNAPVGVEDLVKRRAVALEPAARPKVPLTAVQGGSLDPRYSAVAATQVLAAREAISAALKRGDGAGKALERDQLRADFKKTGVRLDSYFTGYAKHWINIVENDLRVKPEKDFQRQLTRLRPWEVNDAIGRLLKAADEALTGFDLAVGPDLAARAKAVRRSIKAGRERVGSQLFSDKCKKVLRKWAEASSGTGDLRATLLGTDAAKFKDEYLVSSRRDDVVVGYWLDLSLIALTHLGDGFQKGAGAHFKDMALLKKFPLAAPGIGSLSANEVLAARRTFDKLRADPSLLPAKSLGAGGKTGIAALDAAIRRLASYEPPRPDRAWFAAAGKVLAGLPANQKGLECEVSIIAVADQAKTSGKASSAKPAGAIQIWRLIALRQGGRRIGPARTEQLKDHVLGKVLYPGEEMNFELFKFPDGKPHRTVKVEGPWAALALLHRFKASRSEKNKLEWVVDLAAKDDLGYPRTLRLKFKFSRELPPLKEWPTGRQSNR